MADQVAVDAETSAARTDSRANIEFYDREAEAYFHSTLSNDLSALYRVFFDQVPAGGLILDAGSGSGRDTLAFRNADYRVEAFDASRRLAALSERMTGVPVEVTRFEDWRTRPGRYDGIWCFASLLHVAEHDLERVVGRLTASLAPGGALFASFKQGDGLVVDERGRRFTNLTVDAARALFEAVEGLELVDAWGEGGPTALGDPTVWVYVLARRRV